MPIASKGKKIHTFSSLKNTPAKFALDGNCTKTFDEDPWHKVEPAMCAAEVPEK